MFWQNITHIYTHNSHFITILGATQQNVTFPKLKSDLRALQQLIIGFDIYYCIKLSLVRNGLISIRTKANAKAIN